ncbi:hypothetical protein SAMN04487926_12150 [Paraburkholderia steynii]|uniref:Bbp19-like phage domain-containing protein n=1 Tax=Paraburkholderia steynii TaxID=1245441 RepID=A0A7Z7FLR4_9BURK|nr:hypothetical protein [Paraburkholderia steynii]SDI65219.1 hypothetical protein SAMN04487926_12150 [Paraburkholderia steynii]
MRADIPGAAAPQATPREYEILFNSPTGQLVLEDLVNRFGAAAYVRGGLEAQRETDFRLGRRAVVDHILTQMNRAVGAEPPEGE